MQAHISGLPLKHCGGIFVLVFFFMDIIYIGVCRWEETRARGRQRLLPHVGGESSIYKYNSSPESERCYTGFGTVIFWLRSRSLSRSFKSTRLLSTVVASQPLCGSYFSSAPSYQLRFSSSTFLALNVLFHGFQSGWDRSCAAAVTMLFATCGS